MFHYLYLYCYHDAGWVVIMCLSLNLELNKKSNTKAINQIARKEAQNQRKQQDEKKTNLITSQT